MTSPANAALITASQLRSAMLGRPIEGVEIVRQAWRVTDDDSDELNLVSARGGWWVVRRASDQITVWAYAGETEAETGFERLVAAGRHGEPEWHEATEVQLDA